LTRIVNLITTLGDDKILAAILIVFAFGVNFQKGILLMQIFQWTQICMSGLKYCFSMPRPTYVHGDIQNLQHSEFDVTPYTHLGAKTFFGSLDSEILTTFRNLKNSDYGFPSGHASQAAVLWGGIAILFRKRVLYWGAAIIAVMVAFSRMYLGRHFLGDVLGGLALAGIILLIANIIFIRLGFQHLIFSLNTYSIVARMSNCLINMFTFILPIGLSLYSAEIFGDGAGYLVGTNAALLLIISNGVPEESGSLLQRVFRVLLGVGIFFTFDRIFAGLFDLFNLSDIDFFDNFLAAAIPTFFCYSGTILIGYKLKLYKKQTEPSDR
jgi:membrane-associated phospholipid phosphatase